jgi:hypothetical protein
VKKPDLDKEIEPYYKDAVNFIKNSNFDGQNDALLKETDERAKV